MMQWPYGKGELALKTLNQNFGMNITDYAYVNYSDFVEAIDYIGGIYVDVSAEERDHINTAYNSWHRYYGHYIPKVKETGLVFAKVLEHAGVYGRNQAGKDAFLCFVDHVNKC